MAGIYVHVPFCKVKCHYCDFHFSVQLKNRPVMVESLLSELDLRVGFLGGEPVNTIYFGGGTPSVLEVASLARILNKIYRNFSVSSNCEITLECNPDDLEQEKLIELKTLGVNRLSIGIQSFNDRVLQFMNRSHSASQAKESLSLAQKLGFDNLTIDLIYGVPNSTMDTWKKELAELKCFEVPHLSAYCLTIEENTVFGNWYKKGKIVLPEDELSLNQFEYLIEFARVNGLEQYEISNFAKPDYISKHNSAYWLGEKYLGIGPSAHSYNQIERSWNISNNTKYIKSLQNKIAFSEKEILSEKDRFNDYILTRIRTKWGIDWGEMNTISEQLALRSRPVLDQYVQSGEVIKNGNVFTLSGAGKFISDTISSDLFQ